MNEKPMTATEASERMEAFLLAWTKDSKAVFKGLTAEFLAPIEARLRDELRAKKDTPRAEPKGAGK
jgi:hypothetical protein